MNEKLFAELMQSGHEALAHAQGKQELRTPAAPCSPPRTGPPGSGVAWRRRAPGAFPGTAATGLAGTKPRGEPGPTGYQGQARAAPTESPPATASRTVVHVHSDELIGGYLLTAHAAERVDIRPGRAVLQSRNSLGNP